MKKGKISLTDLIFMALCCDMGLFLKKLIAPATNLITDSLHIPGGIGTSFSLMFVIIGAYLCGVPGCAALMGAAQGLLALAIGTVGSMGALAPLGYIIPGVMIDLVFFAAGRLKIANSLKIMLANALAGVSAALCANIIVFRLSGPPLWLYLSVALTSGIISGWLGKMLINRLSPVIGKNTGAEMEENNMKTKRFIVIIVLACLVLVCALAAFHNGTRNVVPENSLAVEYGGNTEYLDIDALSTVTVSGQVVNGKGETRAIEGQGISLKSLLGAYDLNGSIVIKAVAEDEYYAEIRPDEITADDKAFLLIEDGKARLYVFGDENSKRNVSGVVRIVIE